MRDTFSREQLVAGLKQLAWVAPVTLLVWVWAEREQQTTRDVRFAVEVRSSNPRASAQLRDPVDGYVSATLRGPRIRLEELRSELAERLGAVRFEVPSDLPEGDHPIPVSLILDRDERFGGVSVTSSEPKRVTVNIDSILDEIVAVEVRKEDLALFESPQFSPAKVKVRIPRRTKENLFGPTGKLVVYADLAALPDRTPGRKTDVAGVRVYVPNAEDDVKVEPNTVLVSLNVKEQGRTFSIPSITIFGAVPPGLTGAPPEIDPPSVVDVVISGTPEAIDAVSRNGGADVKAFVDIVGEDRGKGPLKKVPWFRTPEGTKVISWKVVDVPNAPVEVTVSER